MGGAEKCVRKRHHLIIEISKYQRCRSYPRSKGVAGVDESSEGHIPGIYTRISRQS
jgi:hypothetical protein